MSTEHIPVVGEEESPEEKYEKRLKELEKANRGLIEDLQSERQARHQMEQEIAPIRRAFRPEPQESSEERVNRLAQDPDRYIKSIVEPALNEVVGRLERRLSADQAYRWLAKQEGIDPSDIPGSDLEKEIVRVTKENGLTPLDHMTGVRMAYKALKVERDEKKSKEEQREEAISNQSGQKVAPSSQPGTLRFTDAQIASMTPGEYEKNREAILAAQERGQIKTTLPSH